MIYDGPPSYSHRGFTKGFKEETEYFVAYIDNNDELKTKKVFVEAVYSESTPIHTSRDTARWYVKLYIPELRYKTFLHKWAGFPYTKYEFLDEYIHMDFVKETEEEAKVAYLNIMKKPHKGLIPTMKKLHDDFADKCPDVYFSKILTYKGLSTSHPPHYQSKFNNSYSK